MDMNLLRGTRFSLATFLGSRYFNCLLLGAAAYSFLLSNSCNLKEATCIDYYWLDHWLIGYSSGFARRGFLGWMHNSLFGNILNIPHLNIACGLAVVLLFYLLGRALLSVLDRTSQRVMMLFFVGSPVFSVFIETLGDPLHICILLYCAIGWIIISRSSKTIVSLTVVSFVVVSSLIHEASLLLLAPGPLVILSDPRKDGFYKRYSALLVVILTSVLMVFAVLLLYYPEIFSSGKDTGDVLGFNPLNSVPIYRYSGYQSVTFKELLVDTFNRYFGNPQKCVDFALKIVRTSIIPVGFFALIYYSLTEAIQRRILVRVYLSLATASLPLYVIAYDWGRFAVYTLIAAIITALIIIAMNKGCLQSPMTIGTPVYVVTPLTAAYLYLLFSALLYPINSQYRIDGIPKINALASLLSLFLFLVAAFIVRTSGFGKLYHGDQSKNSRRPPSHL